MQINKHYVLGLALSFTLVACGKDEKTKTVTVTVENPKTQQELVEARQKRDELQALVDNAPDAVKLKEDLDAANGEVTELKTKLDQKDLDIAAKQTELDAALAAGRKVPELEQELKDLKEERDRLKIKVDAADIFAKNAAIAEANYKALLTFALENNATTAVGQTLGDKLTKKLADLKTLLENKQNEAEELNTQIVAQGIKVGNAETARTSVLVALYDEYETLDKIKEANRTQQQKDRYTELQKFVKAGEDLEKAKTAIDKISKDIDKLKVKIKGLNTTLENDKQQLAEHNAELVKLARADQVQTPRGVELTKLIPALVEKIAKDSKDRDALDKDLVKQGEEKATQAATIQAKEKIQAEFFDSQQEIVNRAFTEAKDALKVLTEKLDAVEAEIKTKSKEQESTKDLQDFYKKLKLAPVEG